MAKDQYTIVITPAGEGIAEVKKLKQGLAVELDAAEAMKSPLHITLERPFHAEDQQISNLVQQILYDTHNVQPFDVTVTGYTFLDKNRVILLEVNRSILLDLKAVIHNAFLIAAPEVNLI